MSRLLSLPPELRVMIWNHVFILPEEKIQIRLSPHAARHNSVLRVLTVCKTILHEALHIFYQDNDLALASTASLFQFLSTVHRKRRLAISSLTLLDYGLHYTGFQCASRAFSMLLLCPNLTSFQLNLTTEESWDILDTIPQYAYEIHWQEYQNALDCLSNLRGLTSASVRGIDPIKRIPGETFTAADLSEARCHRADALRIALLRPAAHPAVRIDEAPAKCPPKLLEAAVYGHEARPQHLKQDCRLYGLDPPRKKDVYAGAPNRLIKIKNELPIPNYDPDPPMDIDTNTCTCTYITNPTETYLPKVRGLYVLLILKYEDTPEEGLTPLGKWFTTARYGS